MYIPLVVDHLPKRMYVYMYIHIYMHIYTHTARHGQSGIHLAPNAGREGHQRSKAGPASIQVVAYNVHAYTEDLHMRS